MELWIRSQDKKFIVKVNNGIYINKYYGQGHINGYEITCGYGGSLGIYSEERALEVLNEIQKILEPQLIIKDNGKIIGSFEDTIIREGATYELKELSTYVYEMPKE